MKYKFAQAQVIVTVLIILIVLSIIGVAGSMITRMVSDSSDEAMKTFEAINSDATLKKITRNEDLGIIGVQVQEGPDNVAFSGFKIVIKDEFGNSEVHDFSFSLGPLESQTVYFRSDIMNISDVQLYPLIEGDLGPLIDDVSVETPLEIPLVDYHGTCYQENPTARHSRDNNCNLFYLGSYSCEGEFLEPCENAFDGDGISFTSANTAIIYINYSKPINAQSAIWYVVPQTGSYQDDLLLYSKDVNSCFNSNLEDLILKLEFIYDPRNPMVSKSCYNGFSWIYLGSLSGNRIGDESINWIIS